MHISENISTSFCVLCQSRDRVKNDAVFPVCQCMLTMTALKRCSREDVQHYK